MIGWIVFIIIIIIVCFTVLAALVITYSGYKMGRRVVIMYDLKPWLKHKIFNKYRLHKPVLGGNLYHSVSQDEAFVTEKGIVKKTKHSVDLVDSLKLVDSRSGETVIINGISAISGLLKQQYETLLYSEHRLRSENSALRSRVLSLECDLEESVTARIESMSKVVKAVQPFAPKTNRSGGGSSGRQY